MFGQWYEKGEFKLFVWKICLNHTPCTKDVGGTFAPPPPPPPPSLQQMEIAMCSSVCASICPYDHCTLITSNKCPVVNNLPSRLEIGLGQSKWILEMQFSLNEFYTFTEGQTYGNIQCVPIKRKPIFSVRYLHCHARFNQTIWFIVKGIFSSFIWYQTHDDISMHDWKGTI